jgi:tyrosyl-tRNA synthetase
VHRFFESGMAYIDKRGGYGGSAATATTTTTTTTTGTREGVESGRDDLGGVKVLNNLDWFRDVSFLDFLRTVGKLAKVNVMLSRDRYVVSWWSILSGCSVVVAFP